MWTFDNLPVARMKAAYGFAPDAKWLEHVRLSSLKFGGASGSFISKDGLVLTNHHVGRGSVQAVSDQDHDYIKNGFLAATREQEIRIPGMELRTLMVTENITERLAKAVAGLSEKDALKVRQVELAKIQKDLQDKTGLGFDPVTLYQGGETWMYGYKKHTDVRLVMAPEMGIAFFGGDYDNFTYPRHNLDFTLFRIYENGKPYTPPEFLKVSSGALQEGDLTFVIGHPGSTARLETYGQMTYAGAFGQPMRIKAMERQREVLVAYGKLAPENARLVNTPIFGLENGIKSLKGSLRGLQDQAAMARIQQAEKELQAKVAADPKLKQDVGDSWARIDQALARQKALYAENTYVGAASSTLLAHAITLVRMADELALPSEKRLPEFSDANLPSLQRRLGVNARPFNAGVEVALFTFGLQESLAALGPQHAFIKAMLPVPAENACAAAAKAAVEGSKLGDPAVRKTLMAGGKQAILASQDPMILLARKIDGLMRANHRRTEDEVTSVITDCGGRIAKARFKVYGKDVYPDATSTLRLTYGPVAGYPANGTLIQPFTTFFGLFDRALGWGPTAHAGAWALPTRWTNAQNLVNLATPFNFAHEVDTVGGNSGSPVVDRKGELVGLLFDGNIDGLPSRYFYDRAINRSVSVDARAILEALDKVYGAKALVAEIKN
jgi:hypothetical protein